MKVTYIPESNSCVLDINGQTETVVLDDLLDMLPARLVRDKWLVNEIMKKRTDIMEDLGEYNTYILGIVKQIETINSKISNLDPLTDAVSIKFYGQLITGLKSQKDVVRELRHGLRASHNEEGRLANELAQLENVRG
jgi:hypothetical protein